MLVLPIKSLREEDGPLVGQELLNLAKLAWADLPVAPGIVVSPPKIIIQTVLEHFQFEQREIFEQKLTLVQKEILEIPPPAELTDALGQHKIDPKKLWAHLLSFWFDQIRSRIWREGFSPDLLSALTSQGVFFTAKISAAGNCFYDYDRKIAIFELHQSEISDEKKQEIEKLVQKADKKLLLPQIYDWILEKNKLFLVKVTPITSYPEIVQIEEELPQGYKPPKENLKPSKATLKVFLDADESFKTGENLDGVLVSSQRLKDQDTKILQLVEFAQTGQPIIFKLFNDPKAQVKGALNLIHNLKLLKEELEAVKFVRNKKHLNNVTIAIPQVRSAQEFNKLKQELAAQGLSRASSFKLWLEFAVSENFLNLEDYINTGFDGALINLDQLAEQISGFDQDGEEAIFYGKQIKALQKLLEPALKTLHKEKILILAYGNLALHDDLLEFLMEQGVYGIVVEYVNTFSIQERLRLIERKIVRSRS